MARATSLALAMLTAAAALFAQAGVPGSALDKSPSARPALSGYVLTPEWLPVSGGTVNVLSSLAQRVTTIESDGRFRIEALGPGTYDLRVSVPRLMTHRVRLTMPSSGHLMLPPIRLSPPSYVRLRVLSPAGEPITAPRVFSDSYDVEGTLIPERPGEWGPNPAHADGITTIGPLPRGIAVLGVDTPPFARTPLPDVRVTGESPLIDAGTVTLEPGATLQVTVVDGAGNPVPDHEVHLDDGVALSSVPWPPVRTDANGRAVFERLHSGRYTLRARGLQPCGAVWPTAGSSVDVGGSGTVEKRLVIAGVLRLRLTSAGVPLAATRVSVAPDLPSRRQPSWLRQPSRAFLFQSRFRGLPGEAPCAGVTDSAGRVTLPNVPPGRARATVSLRTSTWLRRLQVPADGRQVSVQIPAGILPLRIVAADARKPISGATITWTSGGARVEAAASVTGDVLAEGVSADAGTLAVRAPTYRPLALRFAAPPDVLYEVALEPVGGPELRCRIVSEAGRPLPDTVVELVPHDRLEVGQLATTDPQGAVRFLDVSSGPARIVARADGYAATILESVTAHLKSADPVVVALFPGYRVEAVVESTAAGPAQAIRVLNETGEPLDHLLDAASERSIDRAGRFSVGPLPRGTYVVELRSATTRRRERVRMEDRDAAVTFR